MAGSRNPTVSVPRVTRHATALRAELQPVGEFENRLVDQIISSFWRLRRLVRVEAGIFVWERLEERAERAEREAGEYEKMEVVGLFTQEPKPMITDEEKHEEALSRARRMRSEQEEEIATLGRTFARDAKTDAFSKLSRYETAIERSIYKAWHELQRLQAARRADGDAPPPVAMDLFVSGVSRDEH